MEALEINERITAIKGPAFHNLELTNPINYLANDELILCLVVELLLAEWHPKHSKDDEYHRWFGRYQYAEVEHKDFKTATCLAYIEEFGND